MKVFAWLLAHGLFWTGHVVSRAFLRHDATAFMYPVYNNLMFWSINVQDRYGLPGPWSTPGHKGEDDGSR